MKNESQKAIYNQMVRRDNFTVVAGNCVLEDKATAIETASFLAKFADTHNSNIIPIFKASVIKDNRSNASFYRGVGASQAVGIFREIRERYNLPVITDFSATHDLNKSLLEVVDIVQLPAFLSMQTRLTLALGRTGLPVNIKKSQTMHPEDIGYPIQKIKSVGNNMIILTERGTSFGYHDLVVDPRSLHIMRTFGYPVWIDAGHAVRRYGIPSCEASGGCKEYVSVIAKAAVAAGATGLFVEIHPDPKRGKCDAATMLSFEEFECLMEQVVPIWEANNGNIC